MEIKRLTINKDKNTFTDITFNNKINFIDNNDIVNDVISLIFGYKTNKTHSYLLDFSAEVFIDNSYYIFGQQKANEKTCTLKIFDCNGEEIKVSEYLEKINYCEEINKTSNFKIIKSEKIENTFLRYKQIEDYYTKRDFSRITNSYGRTRSFRAFVVQYIKYFKPIKICENKDYYLTLLPDGSFNIMYNEKSINDFLSESESVLYKYYSFITIADFWQRAEQIRNMHYQSIPLIISDFFERLDESIDVSKIINDAKKIERQIIFFVPKKSHLLYYNNNKAR